MNISRFLRYLIPDCALFFQLNTIIPTLKPTLAATPTPKATLSALEVNLRIQDYYRPLLSGSVGITA